MDTQLGKMKTEEQQSKEGQSPKLIEPNTTTTTTTTTTTSSSPSSSPTHEFSFTISVQPSSSPSSFAIDLSPADEIFFHGHLLPLHFLSHFPMSPRRSTTNSSDCSTSATQPIKDVLDKKPINNKQFSRTNSFRTKRRIKVKSFSLFRPMKWRKPCEADEGEEDDEANEETAMKKKVRFDAGIILKSYLRMVRPLLFFRGLGSKSCKLQMRPHSFSSSYPNTKAGKEDRYGRNSAPASFQTSTTTTTNSGPLQAKDRFPTSVKDGSMDELQSAIEAAIAHCKSSSTTQEGKFKFQC
ncbi:hypothetical protein MKW94_003522 [Papaver nudicaule]|uniref:BRI1 kinase inhibitor 1 n=1 Tax=Papaver nudicaule TaxID=74823 RepID=A0AA41S3U4_PAPNU|nr:hypothetical protein [Papaver nudicaule]